MLLKIEPEMLFKIDLQLWHKKWSTNATENVTHKH